MPSFISDKAADNIAISLCVLLAMLAFRWAGETWLARSTQSTDLLKVRQRRFTIRAVTNALLALCLLGVWMSEIQNLVLSLAAVMVALVIATKELLMCVAGAVLRLGGQLFKVGDRIAVNGIHGEVIDHGLFSTTIMETAPRELGHAGTGRRLTLPNSLFLSVPVTVEAQPRQFAPHRFAITLETPVSIPYAIARLEAAAEGMLAADLGLARRFHRLAEAGSGVEIAGPGFEVAVATTDIGKLQFNLMLYCLAKDAHAFQQTVTRTFLTEMATACDQAPKPKSPDIWTDLARKLRDPQAQPHAA